MKFSLNKFLKVPSRQHSKCLYIHPCSKTPKALTSFCCSLVNKFKLPKQFEWTVNDVLDWIENLGFPQYKDSFKLNFIDGRKLILIDAPALIKMNIKIFDHIKTITGSIREMYNMDQSIKPINLFKFYKSNSGYSYETITCCDYLKKAHFLNDIKKELNHFELLHLWLKHISDFQNIRIGMIKRENLYHVQQNVGTAENISLQSPDDTCACDMPPCDCKWTIEELNDSLKITLLLGSDD